MPKVSLSIVLDKLSEETREKVLEELACSISQDIKVEIAKYDKTPPRILSILREDESGWVRQEVAYNPNTLDEDLDKLSKDKNKYVSYWATINRLKRKENK